MPPSRRHDVPVHSLDALVLQAARQDYAAASYRRVFRPSFVFHRDLRFDPYHREYASSRNPLMQSVDPGQAVSWDDTFYFSLVMPRPPPAELTMEAAVQAQYAVEDPPANKRVRRLSALVVTIALAIRHKLRSLN